MKIKARIISIVFAISVILIVSCRDRSDLAKDVEKAALQTPQIVGIWKKRGSSLARTWNPEAKEVAPGIYEFTGEVLYNFEADGKFSQQNETAEIEWSGTWTISGNKMTIIYKENDGSEMPADFTIEFIDNSHIIFTLPRVRELFEKG